MPRTGVTVHRNGTDFSVFTVNDATVKLRDKRNRGTDEAFMLRSQVLGLEDAADQSD
jgi:hypothetical protein